MIDDIIRRLDTRGLLEDAIEIAQRNGVTLEDALSRCRYKSVVRARHEIWYLVWERFRPSYPELQRMFEMGDHTTILSAVRKVRYERISRDNVD